MTMLKNLWAKNVECLTTPDDFNRKLEYCISEENIHLQTNDDNVGYYSIDRGINELTLTHKDYHLDHTNDEINIVYTKQAHWTKIIDRMT